MNENYILNRRYCSDNKICLDNGFFFGLGVFETLLVKDGIPIFFKEHIERLRKSLKVLEIEFSYSDEDLYRDCLSIVKENCALKIAVSEKNTLITIRDFSYPPALYEKGFWLKESTVIRNSTSHFSKIKSFHYGDSILEKRFAINQGFDDALLFNEKGYVAETSMCNIFFEREGVLYTPHIENGILPGVVRDWIIQNFKTIEGDFTKEDLYQADCVFITNSLMGIMPVTKIDKKDYASYGVFSKYFREYQNFINASPLLNL